jgi:hypothetical protein
VHAGARSDAQLFIPPDLREKPRRPVNPNVSDQKMNMQLKQITVKKGVLLLCLLLMAGVVWNFFELPTSIDETNFRYRLSAFGSESNITCYSTPTCKHAG